MKIQIEIDLSELMAILETTKQPIQTTQPTKESKEYVICQSCKKVLDKSSDVDLDLCDECKEKIDKHFGLGYKTWDELHKKGKEYRLKKFMDNKPVWKEVYNPEKDSEKTGTEDDISRDD